MLIVYMRQGAAGPDSGMHKTKFHSHQTSFPIIIKDERAVFRVMLDRHVAFRFYVRVYFMT